MTSTLHDRARPQSGPVLRAGLAMMFIIATFRRAGPTRASVGRHRTAQSQLARRGRPVTVRPRYAFRRRRSGPKNAIDVANADGHVRAAAAGTGG
jgi:hypothetical protein